MKEERWVLFAVGIGVAIVGYFFIHTVWAMIAFIS